MKYVVSALASAVFILFIMLCVLETRVVNLGKQQMRIEESYQLMVRENRKLIRMNEQNLRLLSQGGWYGECIDNSD